MSLRLRPVEKKKLEPSNDLVIVGGGPAGVAAAIYGVRFGLKTAIITEKFGGLLNEAGIIDDYPGLPDTHASNVISKFRSHVEKYGVQIIEDTITEFRKNGDGFIVKTLKGQTTNAKVIILAIGTRRRKLGVPGEDEFRGRGVSYCSICDAPLFKNATVAVVGGGDAALEGALILSEYANKIYLIHRRDQYRAQPYYVNKILVNPKIERLMNTVVTEIKGDKRVTSIIVRNLKTGESREIKVDGIFIEIGFEPHREFLEKNGIKTDDNGYIIVDEWMNTNIPGVFAAGDCTNKWIGFRQVITAAAMGAVAAYSAYNYIMGKRGSNRA